MKLLLDNGADINAQDSEGRTRSTMQQSVAKSTSYADDPGVRYTALASRKHGCEIQRGGRGSQTAIRERCESQQQRCLGNNSADETKSRASFKVLSHRAQQDERLLKLLGQFVVDRIFRSTTIILYYDFLSTIGALQVSAEASSGRSYAAKSDRQANK